jgi:hypothetical protein
LIVAVWEHLQKSRYELDRPENVIAGLGPNSASLPLVRVLACHQSTIVLLFLGLLVVSSSADVLVLNILLYSILIGINISGILDHSFWLREACILLSVTSRTPMIRFATPLLVTHEDLLWPTSL